MSTFRNTILSLEGKEAYFLLYGEEPVKATILKINDDLVVLKLSEKSVSGYSELVIHIDKIILVTA